VSTRDGPDTPIRPGGDTPGHRHDHHEEAQQHEQSVAPHVRRLRWRALRHRLRESLLFLPVLMVIASFLLAIALAELDRREAGPLPKALTFTPGVATTLLTTIAGATITTAGVVFSLLLLSLQLASGQFSPRVLRGFWRDRNGQVLIGLLLSTFAFCVIALTEIDASARRSPRYTVLFALLLTLASVIGIVIFLDRLSRAQYVGRIMQRVVRETLDLVAELPYGPHIGMQVAKPVPPPDVSALGPPFVVCAPADGWVQQISRRAVVGAVPDNSVVRLETRVGAYLTRDTPLATIWPVPPAEEQAHVARLVAEAVIVGAERSMQQDIDFGLRQLNDIALRALSPAVNDPTTAVETIHRIGSVMRPLLLVDLPAQSVCDEVGRVLLTPEDLDHGEYVRDAFDQLRIYAAPHPQVQQALVHTLRMLKSACAGRPGRERALAELDRQLALARAGSAKAGLLPEDLALVEE